MLVVHRGERADVLVAALATVFADAPTDPFTPEVIAVPTQGIERWLAHRLATTLGASPGRADGVCANIEFPYPHRLVGDALAPTSGIDARTDPWQPSRLVWPLLEIIESSLHEHWLRILGAHLGSSGEDPTKRHRRFEAARHIAQLFDRYGTHRPDMVLAWLAGADTDADGASIPADAEWQPRLWRTVREHIGVASPAERLRAGCDVLRDDPGLVDLPNRLALFGITRLPAAHVDVLRAVAEHRDVHLCLLHPSPGLWDRLADHPVTSLQRVHDTTRLVPEHPLVRTWGNDTREIQLVLGRDGSTRFEHHVGPAVEPTTTLRRLQAAIADDVEPAGVPLSDETDARPDIEPDDRSIQVHACHGRRRQVEILRDVICGLLADDPTLEPRDIVVMCPDIEHFAPLVHAVFESAVDTDQPTRTVRGLPVLPYRLADRSLRETNPLLGVVAELLRIASGRLETSVVVELLGRDPVRRRFRFSDSDLETIREWIDDVAIRWGLDADHRDAYGLSSVVTNSWEAGLDRLLIGVTMSADEARTIGDVFPADDVDSGRVGLAGRFAECIDRLRTIVTRFRHPAPLATWAEHLDEAVDLLCLAPADESWQRMQVDGVLRRAIDEATVEAASSPIELSVVEVRELLADRLAGMPGRSNFRTGALTFCTLVPMRSIPHRVVCLLGLDAESFPRTSPPDGDDLLRRNPCLGDRDPRSEDRQLLLDALMAAEDHLVITYAGRDERSNAVKPPAVPVSELLEVAGRTVAVDDPFARFVTEHPLQPFDPRAFTPPDHGEPWSFDEVDLAGARAMAGPRRAAEGFLAAPLEPSSETVVGVDDLARFFHHPVRAFFRSRLGLSTWQADDELVDQIAYEVDPLGQWAIGDRLLTRRLAGVDAEAAGRAELLSGRVPPGPIGVGLLAAIEPKVGAIVEEVVRRELWATTGSVEVDLTLDDGRTIVGTVPGLVGDVIRSVTYSSMGPRPRLTAWVHLLAATAAHPERSFTTATIARWGGRARVAQLPALGDTADERLRRARGYLHLLVDLRDRGMCEPLPLPCKTAYTYAETFFQGRPDEAYESAKKQWWEFKSDHSENQESEHAAAFGPDTPFDELFAIPARDDETGKGWYDADTTSRFARLALRLWAPIVRAER